MTRHQTDNPHGPEREPELPKAGFDRNFLVAAAIIAFVSFAVYSTAIANGFIYDDYSQVVRNTLIRDMRHIPDVFLKSMWTFEGAPPLSNYYRPMVNLLYTLSYFVFGPAAWGFHLLNLVFHAANSILVFFITAELLCGFCSASSRAAGMKGGRGFALYPSLLAALVFATHPIHTEAVTWIAGLSDVSFAFFFLLSFYLYIHSSGWRTWKYASSILFFSLSVLCKEPGLTLPGILIAYDYALGKREIRSVDALKRYFPYLLVACAYFAVRMHVLGALTPLKRVAGMSDYQYGINVLPLFKQYLSKLFLPVNLNFWPVFHPITSLLSAEGILSLCVLAVFTLCLAIALRKNRLVFFSLLFVLIPLVPAFYIKGIIGKPFADRYLYLPSFGFALLSAALFSWSKTFPAGTTNRFAAVFVLLTGVFSIGTISRNLVWRDEYSLFADTVKKSPDSVVPRMEFGNALLARGRFDEAIQQYQETLKMEPMLYTVYHHLGLAFAGENRLYEAIDQYKIALALNPGNPQIHADLGRAYAGAKFRNQAVQEFRIALQLQPTAANHNLLGIAYAQNRDMARAIDEFKAAAALDSAQPSYASNLAEAVELERSLSGNAAPKNNLAGEFTERPADSSDIFNFAW